LFSPHNIEHLYPHEVSRALSEFARVIKPDGFAVIICPDLKAICHLVAQDRLTDPAYELSMGPISSPELILIVTRSVPFLL
jgi:predicted SAM-dependent methyltransferase